MFSYALFGPFDPDPDRAPPPHAAAATARVDVRPSVPPRFGRG